MTRQSLPLGDDAEILFRHVAGDLALRGWSRSELSVTCDGEIDLAQTDAGVQLTLHGDSSLQVPSHCRVRMERVEGDLSFSAVRGPVILDRVEGDLAVRDVGSLAIGLVDGDCSVRMVRGDCSARRIEGDASFMVIGGNLSIDEVTDDLNINGVRGSITAAADDDVALRLALRPGVQCRVRAGGDLSCRVRALTDVAVELSAGGDLNLRRIPLPEPIRGSHARFVLAAPIPYAPAPAADTPEADRSDTAAAFDAAAASASRGQQAGPAASLHLVAGNDLTLVGLATNELSDMDFDFDVNFDFMYDFGPRAAEMVQQFATKLESHVGDLSRQMDEKMSNIGNTEQIATRLQEGILAAARKAEEKISEAMRRMEARQREADKRQGGAPWGGAWAGWAPGAGPAGAPRGPRPPAPPVPPAPPQPPRNPVSDEERLLVLRMVSDGTISVDQAEKLLAALTGRGAGSGADR